VNASADDVRIMRGRYTLNVPGRPLALDEVQPYRLLEWLSGSKLMRMGFALLIFLWCAGCALAPKPQSQGQAQAPAPQQTAALPTPAQAADPVPRFECSDGTISFSQTGCLVNMARARLPAGQANEAAPDAAR
jgi:hypothetical protein